MGFTLKVPGSDGKILEVRPRLVVAGLDWGGGGGDPLAIEVGAKARGTWYNFWELYEERITHPDLLRVVRKLVVKFGVVRFWCDQSQPHAIGLLQTHDIPAVANQIKEVEYGIRTVYGLVKAKRLIVDGVACPDLVEEFGLYGYARDRQGEVVGRKPVDKHNHALDCVRYYTTGEGEIPPEDDVLDVFQQPTMRVNEDGQWVDNPRATIAQAKLARQDPDGWNEMDDAPHLQLEDD